MQIFEKKNSSYRATSLCGYCRGAGHNASECPRVAEDWEIWKTHTIPLNSPTLLTARYFSMPKYWGEWYTRCQSAMAKQEAKKQLKKKAKRVINDRKCGFCGGHLHNRRNCSKMKTFLKDCYTANENWRKAAYKTLVQELGISVGAAIEVEFSGYSYGKQHLNEGDKRVAVVTAVNFDKLNVMADLASAWGNHDYRCSLKVEVLVDNQRYNIKFKDLGSCFTGARSGGYGNWTYTRCIANAPKPLDPLWPTQYKEAFDWLTKKKSYGTLYENKVVDCIDRWKYKR